MPRRQTPGHLITAAAIPALMIGLAVAANAAPAIRTSQSNPVPGCVTPARLMSFLEERNERLDPRYRDIARWYQYWGERLQVRWDYAFYQMAIETNYLKYRRGNGRRGDVHEKQNNFAGIGATGGGVAGDRFPDVKTGVQAQFQHLVAYSGERIDDPVARRTRENQDEIIAKSRRLNRAVTFGDLARRWAADRQYAKSIDFVADQFRTNHCDATVAAANGDAHLVPVRAGGGTAFAEPSKLGGTDLQRLAGPNDDLPWAETQNEPAQPESPGGKASTAKSTEQPVKRRSPVRTIWSRDGKIDTTPAPVSAPPAADAKAKPNIPAAKPEPIARVDDPALKPKPAASPVESVQPAPATAASNDVKEEPPVLPTFRIAPRIAEPSRLGGPVPQLLDRDAGVHAEPVVQNLQAPRASFKEVIVAPLESGKEQPVAPPCRIVTATYGGKKTLLVRSASSGETRYTALTVLDGFEKTMFDTFAKANGGAGEIVGEYATKDEALADARANCPAG